MTEAKAREWRRKIELAASTMPDKDASESIELFRTLKGDGSLVEHGTRINWNGVVKKATVDLYDNEQNTPDAAPTLWEDIEYRNGIRIIPEVITVTKLFSANELGWWGDTLYRSKVNSNVYTPAQYAQNWEVVER